MTYSEEGESVEDSDQDPAPQRDVLVGQQVQRNSCTYHFLNNNSCTNNSLPMKVYNKYSAIAVPITSLIKKAVQLIRYQ